MRMCFVFSCWSQAQSSLTKNPRREFSSCRKRVFSVTPWTTIKWLSGSEKTLVWTRKWLASTSAIARTWTSWTALWSTVDFQFILQMHYSFNVIQSKVNLFCSTFTFQGLRIDEALRLYLEAFRLPGEAPVIQRLLETFTDNWHVRHFSFTPEQCTNCSRWHGHHSISDMWYVLQLRLL